jgi:excisionase family DNA binding protein
MIPRAFMGIKMNSSVRMLLTLQEAAARLRTPRRRLRELINENRIAFLRTGKKKVMIPRGSD